MEKIRIILVDDHSLYRDGLRKALEKFNDIEILAQAENGQELLNKLEYLRPDVVITGLQMPVMDGVAVVPLIRQRYPALRIIILTMVADCNITLDLLTKGANAYLHKISDSTEIYAAIKHCTAYWLYLNNVVIDAVIQSAKRTAFLKEGFESYELEMMRLYCAGNAPDTISKEMKYPKRVVEMVLEKLQKETNTASAAELADFARAYQWF